MGTGSRGGGGGGGYSGGASIGIHGGYHFGNGVISNDNSPSHAETEIKKFFKNPNKREYLIHQLTNPLVCGVYSEFFILFQELVLNHSWSGIGHVYGIADTPGCLQKWCDLIFEKHQILEQDERMRAVVKRVIFRYILKTLGGNSQLIRCGNGEEIVANVNKRLLEYISNNFLGGMITEVLLADMVNISSIVESDIREIAMNKADVIVNKFNAKYRQKQKGTYREMFHVFRDNPDWFLKELRS